MKIFYILLFPFFFICCNSKNKEINSPDSENMNISSELNLEDSTDIPLIFVLGEYDLKQYSDLDTIGSKEYNLDKVIYDQSTIGIQYSFDYNPESDNFTTKSFELKADNGQNFTIRELLFKINKETFKDLSKEDHYILEGLLSTNTKKNNTEYYELVLGS